MKKIKGETMASVTLPKGVDTKYFIEGPGCLSEVPELLALVNESRLPVLLVEDKNTKKAAGEKLAGILAAKGVVFSELLLKEGPLGIVNADYERVVEIREIVKQRNVFPVAVGGGTINDLVKRAAFELEIPYACVGTAASVDGYCSSGASLVYEGYKVTMNCPAPAAVAADADGLASAPYDMTASGYADLYAKLSGGVDWVLADRLGIEKVHNEAWNLVQKELPLWLAKPEKLKAGDSRALSNLFRGLTMSGCAMQVYKDSRPASGAEHLVSHVWEMEHLSANGLPVSHVFKVGMGTVISVALMEAFYNLQSDAISVDVCRPFRQSWEERRASVAKHFPDPKVREMIEKVCREKWIDDDQWAERVRQLSRALPELKAFTAERLGSKEKVIADLKKAGCPVSPAVYGVSPEGIKDTVIKAQMMRKRYTILDAVYETGWLEKILNRLY
jgi:glycerol-1-phosphate dehydrogenase [NAD(P)+]